MQEDPTTPFITATLAERDRRAREGDVSPFPKLWLQPDLPPDYFASTGYGDQASQAAKLIDLGDQ